MAGGVKIIDWDAKGNVIRFYLGHDDLEKWCGDDWNDAPWDLNAGSVYSGFVCGHIDIALAYDIEVEQTGDGEFNTRWSKDDMRERRVPMLIFIQPDGMRREVWMGDGPSTLNEMPGCIFTPTRKEAAA